MKIKYHWESSDFDCGVYLTRQSYSEGCEDISGVSSVTFKLCYDDIDRKKRYKLVSVVDGQIGKGMTCEEMLSYLNSDEYTYRKTSKEELIKIVSQSFR